MLANQEAGPVLRAQHQRAMEARGRLYGHPGARPGANMPRTATVPYQRTTRQAVDYIYALRLVCEDQQISTDQILNSNYSAAIAARHMLWTVLYDGGHTMPYIASIFRVDASTVRLGIKSFRDFQKGQLV